MVKASTRVLVEARNSKVPSIQYRNELNTLLRSIHACTVAGVEQWRSSRLLPVVVVSLDSFRAKIGRQSRIKRFEHY